MTIICFIEGEKKKKTALCTIEEILSTFCLSFPKTPLPPKQIMTIQEGTNPANSPTIHSRLLCKEKSQKKSKRYLIFFYFLKIK